VPIVARKRFGRIAIAIADSGMGAYTDVAIDQAHQPPVSRFEKWAWKPVRSYREIIQGRMQARVHPS
jgi:hypothetical protein